VAEDGKLENRARAKVGAKVGIWSGAWSGTWPWLGTWPVGAARPISGAASRGEFAFLTQVRQWAAQEAAAGRLLPWLVVAYGLGIVINFTAEHEPVWQVAAGTAVACSFGAVMLRRHLHAFVLALFVAAIACGFAAAAIKTASIAHPILRYNASGVTVAGFVELREESQHTDRIVIRVERIEGNRIEDKPQRVRLSVKRGMAPAPGSFIEVKALLDPPLQPLMPGSYDRGVPRLRPGADSSLGTRAALWGTNEIVSLTIASLVAGFATTPYAAYHFHRLAPYGVIANLLAMPVVSAWVMPWGLIGLLAIPFGFDGECWRQMGYGLEWMDRVSLWVANLPGAVGHVTSFGAGPLLLETAGLLLIGLLKTPLRWSGAAMALAGVIWSVYLPRPDVFVSDDGRVFAVRGASGQLAFHHTGGDTFAVKEWLSADADARDYHDRALGEGIACDPYGCIGELGDGRLVAYDLTPDAFEEDCRRAVLIVTPRDAPADCAAQVISRGLWRQRGALALLREGAGFAIEGTRPANYDRPWSPQWPRRVETPSVSASGATPQLAPRDATPKPEDIEADE
jgi:hypothetical protein